MYIPPAFRVEDANKLASFIQRHSFSTLITHDAAPFASHLKPKLKPMKPQELHARLHGAEEGEL